MICDSPFRVTSKDGADYAVNCGRCPPCKKRRVSQWCFRIMEEDKVSTSAYFVTLTYDSRTLPITPKGFKTLRKKDYQKFMKRLRKRCSKKLRYYAVGEYGSKRKRPHYHAIIFNVDDYEDIHKAWQLGDVHIGNVSGASTAYTLKYIDKEKRVPEHKNDDRVPEFSLMSKGLGKNYFESENMVRYHKDDLSRMYCVLPDGIKVAMPKYFREKIYDEQERTEQAMLVSRMFSEKEAQDREEAKNQGFDYDEQKDAAKYARYKSFYNNNSSKKRN